MYHFTFLPAMHEGFAALLSILDVVNLKIFYSGYVVISHGLI